MSWFRRHFTTVIVAFVTAMVASGSTAAIATIINAQKLDGYTAGQLVRVAHAESSTSDNPLPGPDTLLSTTIIAPNKGRLLISTSDQLDDSAGANLGTVDCWIAVDGTKKDLSVRSVDFYPSTTSLTHEPCATTIALTVAKGAHHITVLGDNPNDLAINFTQRTLTVLYEPFNASGGTA
jgi:hypothetical protein